MVKAATTRLSSEAGLDKKYAKKIATQFNRAQKTIAAHRKCALALKKLQSENAKLFFEQFFIMIRPILLEFKREPHIERLVQFVIQYSSNAERISTDESSIRRGSGLVVDKMDDMTQQFCFDLIKDLLQYAHAKDKAIRFRVCQIVAGLIGLMPEEIEIEEDLCDALVETFVCRLKDKIPAVRQQAVCILARLHNPTTPDDDITKEYIRLMTTDSNKDVRKEVVQAIIPSKYTLSAIIQRTRDVKEDVRKAAYEKLFMCCPLKRLAIAERVSILKNGLMERSSAVKESCIRLLATQWFAQTNSNVVELLQALDVENYTETAELVLNALFTYGSETKDATVRQQIFGKQIDMLQLTPEEALYFRSKIQYLKDHNQEDELEETLPNTTDFCTVIAKHYKECDEFITRQCLIIAKHLDFCDEVGRKNLHIILKHIVMVFLQPEDHVSEIVEALKIVVPSESEFRATIRECVDAVQNLAVELSSRPVTDDDKKRKAEIEETIRKYTTRMKKLKKDEERLKKERAEAKEDGDKDMVAEIQEDLDKVVEKLSDIKSTLDELQEEASRDTVRKDVIAWLRALFVLREVNKVTSTQCVELLLSEGEFLKRTIVPCVRHDNQYVRNAALCVLGQCCALNLAVAQKYIAVFTNHLFDRREEVSIHKTCLTAAFDIVSIHSLEKTFEKAEEKAQSINELLATFKEMMLDKDSQEIATTAVEGCCKLIIFNKLKEHHILEVLSNMVIALFNPATEKFLQMKQCLSMFLPAFAFSSFRNVERVAKIALPTIYRIAHAFDSINLPQAAQFMIYLSDHTRLKKSKKVTVRVSPHIHIAVQLAYEVLVSSKKDANAMCKLFSSFGHFEDVKLVRKLIALLERAKEKTTNKVGLKAVEKFQEILQENLKKLKDDDEEMDDQDTNEQIESEISQELKDYKLFRESFVESLSSDDMLTAIFFDLAGVPEEVESTEVPQAEDSLTDSKPDAEPQSAVETSPAQNTPEKKTPEDRRASKRVSFMPSELDRDLEDSIMTPGPKTPIRRISYIDGASSPKTPSRTPLKSPIRIVSDIPREEEEGETNLNYSHKHAIIARRMSSTPKKISSEENDEDDEDVGLLEFSDDDVSSDEDEDDPKVKLNSSKPTPQEMSIEVDELIDQVPLDEDEEMSES